MLDLALRGGDVVDGTGAPRRRADVGIAGGRVVSVGAPGTDVGPARTELDATGLVVAPGFVDLHTHIDAQVFWDSALTPSSLHGVTTMLAGNCGFTLAPLTPEATDYLVRMLSLVEGMPLAALRAGVPGDWRSTGDYLDRLDGTLALNTGFSVGHSALRRVVMGEDAVGHRASPAQVEQMAALLSDGLAAGALGFSSSWGVAHFDGDGNPVPSRSASADELVALAAVCAEFPGTSLEFLPNRVGAFDEAELDLMSAMSANAGRPLNWNVIRVLADQPADAASARQAGLHARERGGRVVALNMPIPSRARFSFLTGFVLDALPGWADTIGLAPEQRLAALADPAVRARLADGAALATGGLAEIAEFHNRVIAETFSPATAPFQGALVADIAAERGVSPLDALLDIVVADELRTMFCRPDSEPSRADWEASAAAWREGHVLIGASDSGAHLDFTAYFDYPVYIIAKAVRDHAVLSLEEAVHLMTAVPARLYGLRDRGVLTPGAHGDVVVFDEHTLAPGPIETRFDLPSGAGRLYAEPVGVRHVLVNGTPVVSGGALTDARPGTLLRSGRDTETPSLTG